MSVMLGRPREVSSICAWAPKSLCLPTISAPPPTSLKLEKTEFLYSQHTNLSGFINKIIDLGLFIVNQSSLTMNVSYAQICYALT